MAGNNTLSITYKFKGDTGGLKEMVSEVEKMQAAFKQGVEPAKQLNSSLINFAQLSQSFDAIGQSVRQLDGVVQSLASAYAVQQEAEVKLQTVMEQRMGATQSEIQGVKDLCAAQQELGVIGDEVQLAGAQQLATFLSTSQALGVLIPAMNNLAAQQKGLNATSSDLVNIGNLMGKAMQGNAGALTRVGITMTEAQKAALKTGTEFERASVLAQIITANVGEMNAALAKTDAGHAKQIANAIGDIKEKMGSVVASIAPYTGLAASLITTAANAGRAAAAMRGLMAAVFGANGALKFIPANAVASAMGLTAGGTAARFFATGLRMIMAATGVGLVIMGISAAVEYFTRSADSGAESAKGMAKATEDMADSCSASGMAAQQMAQEMQQVRSQVILDIQATKNFCGTKEQEQKIVGELNDRYGETLGYFSSVSDWYHALVADSESYCKQMMYEARMRMYANQMADLENKKYQATHNTDGSLNDVGKVNLVQTTLGSKKEQKAKDEYLETVAPINNELRSLKKGMEDAADKLKDVTHPVTGSKNRPAPKGGGKGGAKSSGTVAAKEEKDALQLVNEQIRDNERAMLTASEEEISGIIERNNLLVAEKQRLEERVKLLYPEKDYTPPAKEEIKTYAQLEEALQYYRQQLRNTEEENRGEIQRTIDALELLGKQWDEKLKPTPKADPLADRIKNIAGESRAEWKSQDSPLKGMDFETLQTKYREIQGILRGMDGDITAEQRKSLQLAAAEYAKYAKKASASFSNVRNTWGNVKGVVNGVNSIKDAIEGNGNAWEKTSAIIDAAFQIYDGIAGIVDLVNMLTQARQMQTMAELLNTQAAVQGAGEKTAAAGAEIAAAAGVTTANVAKGASGFFAAHSWIPFVGIGLAAAGVAAMIAMMASLPKFADGGIAFGPTLGLFGEYAGAANNPEVVAPLDKLRGMIGESEGGGRLTCSIEGTKLKFLLDRVGRKQSRR